MILGWSWIPTTQPVAQHPHHHQHEDHFQRPLSPAPQPLHDHQDCHVNNDHHQHHEERRHLPAITVTSFSTIDNNATSQTTPVPQTTTASARTAAAAAKPISLLLLSDPINYPWSPITLLLSAFPRRFGRIFRIPRNRIGWALIWRSPNCGSPSSPENTPDLPWPLFR